MSRLDYAPKLKEIQITDIKKGIGIFTPKSDQPVSFAALKTTLKKAGYTLDSAEITLSGTLLHESLEWWLVVESSGQRFALEGESLDKTLAGVAASSSVEMTGDWRTTGAGAAAREVVSPSAVKKVEKGQKTGAINAPRVDEEAGVQFVSVTLTDALPIVSVANPTGITKPLAPIRTTSPGLTVYKGGAVTPRLYFIKQHLGGLEVSRQLLNVSLSYTPTQRLQLEVEVPFSRTAFNDGASNNSGLGLGNITLWSKYRFYRRVKTYGDRQAAARFGLELPTGKKSAPSGPTNASAFVRQQLTPISGGLSAHFDAAFSQAGGRFIFGGNLEAVIRSERDGFRLGHELRANTDLEYVLLPRDYQSPGKELFVILETNFVQRLTGRESGLAVPGSKATEYYLSPGLQYAARPRFVIEGSVQIPLIRNTGPQLLRTDRNLLLGVKYLF